MAQQPPKVKSSTIVYNGFFNVKQDILERHDGCTGPYTSLIMPTPAAIILAQDEQGFWIINKEYRHPTGQIVLGCCGGRLEPGEDPVQGAQRELFEETGYWSDHIELLGECYQCPAITDQIIFYYFAAKAKPKGGQQLDPLEYIEPCLMSEQDLENALRSSIPVDASLFTALWLWKSRRASDLVK
ncbi:MAG: NUDIX hydrolase [Chlamydiales bacterium]|nr:NUDIX hydrolase [Chlamydiales bacterium]